MDQYRLNAKKLTNNILHPKVLEELTQPAQPVVAPTSVQHEPTTFKKVEQKVVDEEVPKMTSQA